MAQISLQDGEMIDEIVINGHRRTIHPYDVVELSDGRRVVSVFHGGRRTMQHRTPVDGTVLRIVSSTGPMVDADGIIVGRA